MSFQEHASLNARLEGDGVDPEDEEEDDDSTAEDGGEKSDDAVNETKRRRKDAGSSDGTERWVGTLKCRIETTIGGPVLEQDILAWTGPQFKKTKIFFSPEYKPSDPSSWAKLRNAIQASANQDGAGLVSKGWRGVGMTTNILICSRGRAYTKELPEQQQQPNVTRTSRGCCKFRFAVHVDRELDRYYIKGGFGCSLHTNHAREQGGPLRKIPAVADRFWPPRRVLRQERKGHHRGVVVWLTGLNASGKSIIANEAEHILHFDQCMQTYTLDEDEVTKGLCRDLDLNSSKDTTEHIRRAGEVAKLMADSGTVVLCAFVSPSRSVRAAVRSSCVEAGIQFCEIYVQASLEVCEKRDPKGVYIRARNGLLSNVAGVHKPYEEPLNPDLVLNSQTKRKVRWLAQDLVAWLHDSGILKNPATARQETKPSNAPTLEEKGGGERGSGAWL